METKKTSNKLIITGVITALAASLCCITPVLALIAGVSGATSTFSWLEPARPYFIGATILVLGFAWYQKLKPRKVNEADCDCEEDEKPSFWQSKKFLGIVTVFAVLMLAFPYYSGIFFPDNSSTTTIIVQESDISEASLTVEGMTCTGCEHSVNHALTSTEGVIEASSSYETGIATVKFDKSKVTMEELVDAIEKETGYKVTDQKINQEH
ncbi:mercuric transport protein MerTP [Crocinitomix algicola]|uniref:mercuric transport protein MerTP n=1 Tax=Crocinitomix algicola TaxID=1740263 RepID=UPI00083352BB|nr:mercuric transport protein MerTP [Crocinitomix algicola]